MHFNKNNSIFVNVKELKGDCDMKIQAVYLDGYKNLSKVYINFDNITALVSLNNFGKSNVLTGIDFGVNFINATNNIKVEMMCNTNLIPININEAGDTYRFILDALTEENGREYRVQYGYDFTWGKNEDDQPKVVSEFLKIKLEEKGQKYTQLINRDSQASLFKSSETGRCTTEISVGSTELVLNKLMVFDKLYYYEIIKKLNSMKIYMENNLDAKNFFRPDPIIRKGIENEMISENNLPRIIYKLSNEYPEKYDLLKDVFKNLFPNIEDININHIRIDGESEEEEIDGSPYIFSNYLDVLFVRDKNLRMPINFSMMSDGAKRVFMILTKIIISSISDISLIAIEEPENSIHPGLFETYIQIINQLLDDCKIIITSHSPYIISYLDPTWIYVGVSKKPGVAEFFGFKKIGKKQLERDADRLRMSTGDYLFSMLADSESNIAEYLECDVNG